MRNGWNFRVSVATVGALASILLITAGGCGGNLTSGGLAEVEVFVAGDDVPDGAQGAPAGAAHPDPPTMWAAADAVAVSQDFSTPNSRVQGTVTAGLQLFLLGPNREWVEVTDGPQEITVDLRSSGENRLARRSVSAGRYIRVRTVLRRVEAQVLGGLVIDGLPFLGPVRVELGSGEGLILEEPTFLELREGEEERLVVALNSQLWLRLVARSLGEGRVQGQALRQAVRVRTRNP